MSDGSKSKLSSPTANKKPKPKLLLAAAGALLVSGGAAAFVASAQDNPDAIWRKSLSTTADRFESFITTATDEENAKKGGKIDGSFKVASPIAIDGTISGEWYETNVSITGEIGAVGVRGQGDIRAIAPEAGETPDVYLRVDGLDGLDGVLRQSTGSGPELGDLLQEVNGSWYKIDRTLVEQAAMDATNSDTSSDSVMLSPEDIEDISTKSAEVLRDRVFTDEADKAIVVVEEYIGEEEFEGADTYKYKVRAQKQQLKDFAVAMAEALETTKVKDLVLESAPEGETYNEAIELDQLLDEIEDMDFENATAEAWVDAKRKFIRNIRITSTEEESYIDLGLNYDDGDELPFYARIVSTEEGDEGQLELGLSYNESAQSVQLTFDFDAIIDGDQVDAQGELKITGSDEEITVETPENAKNVLELLGPLLGAGSGGFAPSGSDADLDELPFDDFEL